MSEERRTKCAADTGCFGREYLPHYFSSRSPKFHSELNKLWRTRIMKDKKTEPEFKDILYIKGKRLVIAAPRGHAKSTVMSLQNVLHSALYGYKKYIMIISDTESQAASFLDSIKCEIEENPDIEEDFGALRGKVWKSSSITLSNGCRIDALGSGQKLRGRRHFARRPDLIVLDDIENDEEVRSSDMRKKLASWFYGAVSKAGDYYTDIVVIGTVLHCDSLLSNLLLNPAYQSRKYRAVSRFSTSPLWSKWENLFCDLSDERREKKALAFFNRHKRQMLDGTEVLWAQKLSYYDLCVMRLSEGSAAFNQEMQNTPIDRASCLFPPDWFSYFLRESVDFKSGNFHFYGYCDPSLGKSRDSDYSAIITVALECDSGQMYVLDADIARRHPNAIIEDIIEKSRTLTREYGKSYTEFGAETNQFQWFLKEQLASESQRQGVYLPICEVRSGTDKTMRVQTLQPYIKNGYIKFDKRHTLLLEQLWDFPAASHDDGPDALEGCVKLCCKNGRTRSISGLRI